MTLRPYKFVVVAVTQRVDDDGVVVAELESQPLTVFGCDGLERFALSFATDLAAATEEVAET